ncbi:hypothetical protein EAI_04559 [Harpegnathos saltator]|uniref:Uncharacterized protein n=1 Tax=Harpegnathos saltator TaxID=610380 RepID=E2C8X6_HARSA|nr:hypothetical protein EAI_04559 [Harpegnathos saltator]
MLSDVASPQRRPLLHSHCCLCQPHDVHDDGRDGAGDDDEEDDADVKPLYRLTVRHLHANGVRGALDNTIAIIPSPWKRRNATPRPTVKVVLITAF